jgi:hypothetical protein
MNKNKLSFSKGNAKLGKHTAIFSLPAGHTCPAAHLCMTKADKVTGKITDGKHARFRCYAALAENIFPSVRKSRWHNLTLLKSCKNATEMAELIKRSLPKKAALCRIHTSGDFFNQDYFDAWLLVARQTPNLVFYAYTKMLPLWIRRWCSIPSNVKLVASAGGLYDHMIAPHKLRRCIILTDRAAIAANTLPIDHDDSHAWNSDGDFALVMHGMQKKGRAAKEVYALRNEGWSGYKITYFKHYKK